MTRHRVAVVGGCGHVGLPLSIALAPHHDVHIYDRDTNAVARVRSGTMPFKDEGAEEGLQTALAKGLKVTSDAAIISQCDTVIVVVGTPVDEHLNPSFTVFDLLMEQLCPHFRAGQTLLLRSTVYPGTSERVRRTLAEKGLDIEVGFCPERVAEGYALKEIKTLPQIVAAFTPKGLATVKALFAPLKVELIELAPLEAELAKLFNNVYRYITFAIANQFYMVASEYNLDFHRILHAVKHNYPRGAQLPAPGFAAGPCLFKDTMQMSALHNNNFFLGHAAMLVNEGLPQFVINRMRYRFPDLEKKTVGLLGMAFKAESDDARESLSYKLKKILKLHCREVLAADPEVRDPSLTPEPDVLARCDVFVIGAPHKRYRTLNYGGRPVIDVWNLLGRGSAI